MTPPQPPSLRLPLPSLVPASARQTTARTIQRALVWIFLEKGAATGRSQSPAEVGLPWAAVKQLHEKGGLRNRGSRD